MYILLNLIIHMYLVALCFDFVQLVHWPSSEKLAATNTLRHSNNTSKQTNTLHSIWARFGDSDVQQSK